MYWILVLITFICGLASIAKEDITFLIIAAITLVGSYIVLTLEIGFQRLLKEMKRD